MNDTLRATFDLSRTAAALCDTLGALRAGGARVLTARLPDPGRMLALPRSFARPLARRIEAVNQVTDAVAVRYGTLHLDGTSHPSIYDSRMWSVDRLHPSERGHRFLAGAYVDLLGGSGFPVGPRPGPDPGKVVRTAWAPG